MVINKFWRMARDPTFYWLVESRFAAANTRVVGWTTAPDQTSLASQMVVGTENNL